MSQQNKNFKLVEFDLAQHTQKHINKIFLLDTSKTPDGVPTAVAYEVLTRANYKISQPELQNLLESTISTATKDMLPFLFRECAFKLIKLFRELKLIYEYHGQFLDSGTVLRGSAHVGKSYVLYHIVHFCRASGWLVLYVPRLGGFRNYDNEAAAASILNSFLKAEKDKLNDIIYDQINYQSLHDFILNGIDTKNYFNTIKNLFTFLRSETDLEYPVLIAVDEWNSKFENQTNSDISSASPALTPYNQFECQDVLNLFGSQKINSGYWLYAVSSSIDPSTDAFQNTDERSMTFNVPSFGENESDVVLTCRRQLKFT